MFLLGNYLSRYNLVMNFESLETWFLKRPINKEYKFVQISTFFYDDGNFKPYIMARNK
jgi:hypothetical protein